MRGLQGKNVIVTGGGGAIGAAICRRFAGYGAKVGVFDKNLDAAKKVAGETGGFAYGVDITDYAAVGKAVAQFETDAGPTGILVNNAGWDRFANFVDTTPDLWDQLIGINLRGPLNVTHAVLKGMVGRSHGRIVNIASDAGRVGSSQEAVYSACKGGIIAFTKTVAREVARKGITLNAVCPGPTDTPLLAAVAGDDERGQKVRAALVGAIPMKRVGQPEDIPGAVCFLASDDAAFITGQTISVSGGLTMHG
ncbi:2-hydroxycyclohexanecarboxyl-CoA dehydrogenase [Enhydrobacter aerosaccus]|uniref:2-hydroxycyclohexanecarboxyl-CoA dehydrogenase n=1 Tax=Enhydrobacter aerosaccus TaxID=225324 RepID=A0A1T4L017_9HYPH|nr:SDR family oxidoreductase [Enhydrobacter aerosaccus]SJZ47951.1 2-hydroxycyclohexanecarboxyl-CoA dehydrogenase [Enhydrobacter aerosaccus]